MSKLLSGKPWQMSHDSRCYGSMKELTTWIDLPSSAVNLIGRTFIWLKQTALTV